MKPLLVTSGEPAGIGPDLCIDLADSSLPLVIAADIDLLKSRAKKLKRYVSFKPYQPHTIMSFEPGLLHVLPITCPETITPGKLDPRNAPYVIEQLTQAAQACIQGEFSGLVTAPVHKAIINQAGIPFTGHTEFFAQFYQVETVVMMLACDVMRVALVTTHLPLCKVADAITTPIIIKIVKQLCQSLVNDFNIPHPKIKIAGLNPHAGESGYLGQEELKTITPAISYLKEQGFDVMGPYPADTMFVPEGLSPCDAYVAMYHDQGLPVIKYAGFNQSVNVTLGLPIIRTSVDHGTALELAGKGLADSGSMLAAVKMAEQMASNRARQCLQSV